MSRYRIENNRSWAINDVKHLELRQFVTRYTFLRSGWVVLFGGMSVNFLASVSMMWVRAWMVDLDALVTLLQNWLDGNGTWEVERSDYIRLNLFLPLVTKNTCFFLIFFYSAFFTNNPCAIIYILVWACNTAIRHFQDCQTESTY